MYNCNEVLLRDNLSDNRRDFKYNIIKVKIPSNLFSIVIVRLIIRSKVLLVGVVKSAPWESLA